MKLIYIFLVIFYSELLAEEVIKLKDTSGKSEKQIQDKVEALEEKKQQEEHRNRVKQRWENSVPLTNNYDWIELKSDEWIKGSFNSLYEYEVEFDSKEFDIQTFDLIDVKQIRTHGVVSVNIQTQDKNSSGYFKLRSTSLEITGILRINEDNVTIIQGDQTFYFKRNEVISIVNGGEKESQYWSAKLTINFDVKSGNTNQLDYSALAYLMRRSSTTRFRMDYIGNISNANKVEISNNHRITGKFDFFMSRKFYITPLNVIYYNDVYQNIANQLTVGASIGYTLVHNKQLEWDISAGPGALSTEYNTVQDGTKNHHESLALQVRTLLDMVVTKKIDFLFDFSVTKMDVESGKYRHHMLTKLDTEITTWLDFDVTFVWDYLDNPIQNSSGVTPLNNDYQFLVGLGVEF